MTMDDYWDELGFITAAWRRKELTTEQALAQVDAVNARYANEQEDDSDA